MNLINNTGYTPNTSTFNNPINIIPSGNITMKNTPFPIKAIPFKRGQVGQPKMIYPENNYQFDADYVVEIPQYAFGDTVQYPYPQPNQINPYLLNYLTNQPQVDNGLFGRGSNGNRFDNLLTNNQISPPNTNYPVNFNLQSTNGYTTNPMQGRISTPQALDYTQNTDSTSNPYGLRTQSINALNNISNGDTPSTNNSNWLADALSSGFMNTPMDLDSSLTNMGMFIGTKLNRDDYGSDEAYNTAKAGRTTGIIAGGLSSALKGAKSVVSGMAAANQSNIANNWYNTQRRKYMINNNPDASMYTTPMMQEGGELDFSQLTPQQQQMYMQQMSQQQPITDSGEPDQDYNMSVYKNGLQPEDYMTGEYVGGDDTQPAVANVESDEYIQRVDPETGVPSDVKKVAGDTKHSDGGVNLPASVINEGDRVISDHLQIGKDLAKELKTSLDISVNPKDTYASVIDKYSKKIGLTDIKDEMKEWFNKLNKSDKTGNKSTRELNDQFISEKLSRLKEKEKPLLNQRADFVDKLFKVQESTKEISQPQEEVSVMKLGGTIPKKVIENAAKRLNISYDDAVDLLNNKLPNTYQNGGTTTYKQGDNPNNNDNNRKHQSVRDNSVAGNTAYGFLTDDEIQRRLNLYWQEMPFLRNNYLTKDGDKITVKKGVSTKQMQNAIKGVYDINNTLINDNSFGLGKEDVDKWNDFYKYNNFTTNPNNVQSIDNKLGNFTTSRPMVYLQFLKQDELDRLKSKGIDPYFSQIRDLANDKDLNLSQETKDKIKNISDKYKDKTVDFGLLPSEEVVTTTPVNTTVPNIQPNIQKYEKVKLNPRNDLFYMPNQYKLFNDNLLAPTAVQPRYYFEDAMETSAVPAVNEINRQLSVQNAQNAMLGDSQMRANQGQIMQAAGSAINNAQNVANNTNLAEQNRVMSSWDNKAMQQENQRQGLLKNYEREFLQARNAFDTNVDNWENHNLSVALNNYNTVNTMRNANRLFSDFQIGPDGVIQFSPIANNPFQQISNNGMAVASNRAEANAKTVDAKKAALQIGRGGARLK